MLVSRGKGAWVLFGPLLIMGIGIGALEQFGSKALARQYTGAVLTGCLILGGLLGIWLSVYARMQPPVWRLEPRTGRELLQRTRHSAYGIGAEIWGVLYLVLAVWLLRSPAVH